MDCSGARQTAPTQPEIREQFHLHHLWLCNPLPRVYYSQGTGRPFCLRGRAGKFPDRPRFQLHANTPGGGLPSTPPQVNEEHTVPPTDGPKVCIIDWQSALKSMLQKLPTAARRTAVIICHISFCLSRGSSRTHKFVWFLNIRQWLDNRKIVC